MTPYKIKTYSNISPKGLNIFKGSCCEIDDSSKEPDGILVRSTEIKKSDLNTSLRAISRAGVGVNNIPITNCSSKGIVIFNTPGANANSVKELVLAGLLLSSRNVFSSIDFVNSLRNLKNMKELGLYLEENKKQFKGRELAGSNLGVVGLGAIGSKVAGMGVALEMNVIGYDSALSVEAAWKLPNQVEPASSLEELFSKSDFITLHVPAVESTKNLVSKDLIENANNASLLNFAREQVVDTDAVLAGLKEKKLTNFITDFPTPDLIERANDVGDVILLPHIGASTKQAEENCAVMAVEQLINFLQNGNINNSVNFPSVNISRSTENRIAITNKNVPAMIGQITTTLGEIGLNIADMTNVSKGEIAYNLIDVESKVNEAAIKKLVSIDNVINVRLIN